MPPKLFFSLCGGRSAHVPETQGIAKIRENLHFSVDEFGLTAKLHQDEGGEWDARRVQSRRWSGNDLRKAKRRRRAVVALQSAGCSMSKGLQHS